MKKLFVITLFAIMALSATSQIVMCPILRPSTDTYLWPELSINETTGEMVYTMYSVSNGERYVLSSHSFNASDGDVFKADGIKIVWRKHHFTLSDKRVSMKLQLYHSSYCELK